VQFVNNILVNSIGYGILSWNPLLHIDYNDIFNNSQANYSNCQPGLHDISADPLLADPGIGNYQLTWSNFPLPDSTRSPCIDAGDPELPRDPDSTISDMGAFYFDQRLPVAVLTISIQGNDIILSWTPIPIAEIYHIYRSTEPYFSITGINPIASVTNITYIDTNALTGNKYFYRVSYEY
jgi:hypothetical protein